MKTFFYTENLPARNEMMLENSYEFKDFYEVKNNLITFNICGFLMVNNSVVCVFPKGLLVNLSDKNISKAQILLKVLEKYSKRSIKNEMIYSGSKANNKGHLLNLIHDILNDYNENGLFRTKIKQSKTNGSGKTNWNKTFKATSPMFINGQFIYLDQVNEKNYNNLSSEITYLHWLILNNISTDFGWLFNFKLPHYNFDTKKLNLNRAKFILKKAINTTFNFNLLTRLKLLLRYVELELKNNSEKRSKLKLIFAYKFDLIWEEICKINFDHNNDISSSVPTYIWSTTDGNTSYPTLRPDIFTPVNSNEVLIIDAKYYTPKNSKSDKVQGLPGSADIGKQMLYRKSLMVNAPNLKLYNVFILPSTISPEKSQVSLYGISSFNNLVLQKEFNNIYAFQIDCLTALKNYLLNDNSLKSQLFHELETIL